MMTNAQRAEYQTRQIELWLMNDEPSYLAYLNRLECRGYFDGSSLRSFVYHLWGNRNPANEGMSRARWGEIAQTINADMPLNAMRLQSIKLRCRMSRQNWFDDIPSDWIVMRNTRAIAAPGDKDRAIASMFVVCAPGAAIVYYYCHLTNHIGPIAGMAHHCPNRIERALNAMRDLSYHSAL